MSSGCQFNAAWEGVEAGWCSGQLAHAWLLHGAPHGAALRFAEKLLDLVFNSHPQIRLRTHPDVIWLEPQSKSRQILIEEVREAIRQLAQTSFSGGWKAAVFLAADRLNDQAANALLKTLEEPPDRTLLILISAEPQALLPTILSRCQRISLTEEDTAAARHWKDPLIDLLGELPPAGLADALRLTGRITGLLDGLKAEFEQEETARIPEELTAKEAKALLDARTAARLVEARTELLQTMLCWQRDVLLRVLEQDPALLHFGEDLDALNRQALLCTRAEALRRVAAVEEMSRQLDRNLPAEPVFSRFFVQMV